jgi:sec-independent protein translocase protein TatB
VFGLGVSELVVIAVLALLIVGPDGLPNAAKTIGKGIRDLRKQKEDLQDTIEKDTQIGDAMRELRSAMRGDPILTRMNHMPSTTTHTMPSMRIIAMTGITPSTTMHTMPSMRITATPHIPTPTTMPLISHRAMSLMRSRIK